MEYIGKKIIRYGDYEFIGDEYKIAIPDNLANEIMKYASKEELQRVLETQVRFENYEAAKEVTLAIQQRFDKAPPP